MAALALPGNARQNRDPYDKRKRDRVVCEHDSRRSNLHLDN